MNVASLVVIPNLSASEIKHLGFLMFKEEIWKKPRIVDRL